MSNDNTYDSALQAIKFSPQSFQILNQLLLPHESVYIDITGPEDAYVAIKTMQVRGAPAIAIVAALSVAVEVHSRFLKNGTGTAAEVSAEEVAKLVQDRMDYLVQSRPTAVNLGDAAKKLCAMVRAAVDNGMGGVEVAKAYMDAAEKMLLDDVQDNKNIGKHGAEWIASASGKKEGIKVMTHCNTGSLATAGYGTALGIIRSLNSSGVLSQAYCTETRPYNQGSRLTAYELVHDKIPATLITDSMASAVMRLHGVDAVIVGADRVARNGDTANKIGTYQLAITARHHGVKFVVAAPTTSVDVNTPSGDHITIEERPGVEMMTAAGPRVKRIVAEKSASGRSDSKLELDLGEVGVVKVAADGINVFNPSFDVTPAELIDAIATEKGVVLKGTDGKFDMESLFDKSR